MARRYTILYSLLNTTGSEGGRERARKGGGWEGGSKGRVGSEEARGVSEETIM